MRSVDNENVLAWGMGIRSSIYKMLSFAFFSPNQLQLKKSSNNKDLWIVYVPKKSRISIYAYKDQNFSAELQNNKPTYKSFKLHLEKD